MPRADTPRDTGTAHGTERHPPRTQATPGAAQSQGQGPAFLPGESHQPQPAACPTQVPRLGGGACRAARRMAQDKKGDPHPPPATAFPVCK